jgi:hypothetical protein
MARNYNNRLKIFKKIKRGEYIITKYDVYKSWTFSSEQFLKKYKFITNISFVKDVAPRGCDDFYTLGYDCTLISNGEGVSIEWIYGKSTSQNKGIYKIILTKTLAGVCSCLFLEPSNKKNSKIETPYIFDVFQGRYLNKSQYPLGKLPLNSQIYTAPNITQSFDPHLIHAVINHTYYKSNIDELNYNAGYFINKNTVRNLYESCSVLQVRQDLFGNGIKRNSFQLNDYSLSGSISSPIQILDDGISNIYTTNINTQSFVSDSNLLLYLGFNEKYKAKIESTLEYSNIEDLSINKNHATAISGAYYSNGFLSSGSIVEPVGTALRCTGLPIEIKHIDEYTFVNDTDFAISFFISASLNAQNTGSAYSYIIAKQEYTSQVIKNKFTKSFDFRNLKTLSGVYPFSIRMINTGSDAGKLYFSRYGGTDEAFITSSVSITGSYNHVVCQKSGSIFYMYVNGALNSTGSCEVNGSVYNSSNILIGSLKKSLTEYYGNLDEVRVYKKALTSQEIQSLSNTNCHNLQALQTNNIGNIYYNTGTVVLSSLIPTYKNILLGKTGSLVYEDELNNYYGFSGKFKSEKKIFQHEIVIPIRANEFNYSSNPTLKKNNLANSAEFKSFVSESAFNVYFTTIGLYNSMYELVAVAKLVNPLPKYQDKDLNIIVRFDVE